MAVGDGSKQRVLLVDDDSISLELAALLLAANGTAVERALGGQQALDLLHSLPRLPDVVLVDYQMPLVTGLDVARFVRSLPYPRPRVIAMSATALPEAELAFFDDFVMKPLDRDELRAAIAGRPHVLGPQVVPEPAAVAAARSDSALDPVRVRKLQAIMPPESILELYMTYVADTRQRIDELERHAWMGDEEAFRRCAHAIKGAAAMTGVPGVAAIAATLEAGRAAPREYSKLFQQMRHACDDVERSMTGGLTPGETR